MRGLPRRPSSCTCRLYTRLHQLSRRLEGQGSRNQKSSVSYCDKVIQFKLIAGLQDIDIKEDILSTEDKSLEETVKMIENKESGRQAKKTVGLQKPAQINKIQPEPGHLQCSHCGRKTHGSSQPEREELPSIQSNMSQMWEDGAFSEGLQIKAGKLC